MKRRRVSAMNWVILHSMSDNWEAAVPVDDGLRLPDEGQLAFNEYILPTLHFEGRKHAAKRDACNMMIANVYDALQKRFPIRDSRNTSELRNATVRIDAADALVESGWLSIDLGDRGRKRDHQRQTRYIPRPRLLHLLADITSPCVQLQDDLIILKEKRAKRNVRVPIPENLNAKTRKYLDDRREWISRINYVNGRHEIRYQPVDRDTGIQSKRRIHILTGLRAIYSVSFNQGGRLYGRHQNLTDTERETISIDGKPTVEVDYSCLQAAILYASSGAELAFDAYLGHIYGKLAREAFKTGFSVLVNTNNQHAARRAWVNEWKRRCRRKNSREKKRHAKRVLRALDKRQLEFEDIMRELQRRHSRIRSHFWTCCGLKLQNKDVELVYSVCLHFCKKGIPILPIHDSFIVQEEHQAELEQVMVSAFQRIFKALPMIKKHAKRSRCHVG